MTDSSDIRKDDDLTPHDDERAVSEAAEAEEALAAAEETFDAGEDLDAEAEAEAQIHEALAAAHHDSLLARAKWSLVHKEMLILLFANCLFFAGALVAWSRQLPFYETPDAPLTGLDTIRGGMILALAIFGFFTFFLNLTYRQLKVWPYLLNAILALWVGLPGFVSGFGSDHWKEAEAYFEEKGGTFLDQIMTPLSTIPPGHWLLTIGGLFVLIVLLKGILGGASAVKAQGAGGRRRRR